MPCAQQSLRTTHAVAIRCPKPLIHPFPSCVTDAAAAAAACPDGELPLIDRATHELLDALPWWHSERLK